MLYQFLPNRHAAGVFPEDEDKFRVFCPFCGHDTLKVKPVWRSFRFVSCDNCKAAGPVKKSEPEAWAAWATRYVPSGKPVLCDDGTVECSKCGGVLDGMAEEYCPHCGIEYVLPLTDPTKRKWRQENNQPVLFDPEITD